MQIGEISKLVGYPNQLNFSRSFKKIFGVSPQHWREENQIITQINILFLRIYYQFNL